MEVNILTLQNLFKKDVRYVIPPFQRPYVWTQEEQWDPLWDDVRNTAERYLDALATADGNRAAAEADTRIHFLGAVVAQQQQTSTGEIEARLVIDGQQRLTTLQLLLDAAQEVFEHRGCASQARLLHKLVLNDEFFTTVDQDLAFKVWPTTTDQDAFRQAMRNELPSEKYQHSSIVQAHEFFKDQITEWLGQSETLPSRAEALQAALLGRLQMVVIDLGRNDDPHVIFETLNSRGTPLIASDLAKNLLMHETAQSGGDAEELHDRYLQRFEEPWWREDVRQGRLFRPRVDVFLNYWLVMRKRAEVPSNEVFKAFRDYAGDYGGPIEQIAADLHRLGETYKALEETSGDSVLGRFLYRWHVMQAGVATPVLMWLLSHVDSGLGQQGLERCLTAVESYLVRRMICRMTTKDYNQVFLDLLESLDQDGPAGADETVVTHLAKQDADSRLWPDDRLLEDAFLRLPIYRLLTRARLRLVLEGIEEQLRTDRAEDLMPPKGLTIEHIMPQYWATHWPLEDGAPDKEEAVAQRNHIVQSIGNLTLINGRLNSAVSNGPWPGKRGALAEHSVLYLNKDLLTRADDGWDEAAIEERARQLSRVATTVWPTPGAV